MTVVIDGQRPAKQPAPPELRLRDVDILRLPQPIAVEIPVEAFIQAGGWIATVPAELA